jgi:hypothetical protein
VCIHHRGEEISGEEYKQQQQQQQQKERLHGRDFEDNDKKVYYRRGKGWTREGCLAVEGVVFSSL